MKSAETGRITRLLQQWSGGDPRAREDLVPLVYQELRKRAAAYLRRERPDHTLRPTALVNEAYLRLMGQERVAWINRAHNIASSEETLSSVSMRLSTSVRLRAPRMTSIDEISPFV